MSIVDRLAAALSDRYRLERELGVGGMATVYLAEDLKHDRKVAVKVLREDLAASLGGGRFLREIKIAAQLQHPNILPLLDSGEADGFLFYVMPFVAGQSLRERIAREGELPVHEAVRLITEVVDALAHAHEHGVVHRDIKPDNVMLSGRHALVTDFGVAKAVSEATGRNMITTLGVALGTPTYMSPEQAAADPNVDHRSDIYAVGVMAYELLTGRPPFTGASPQQVLAAHVTEVPDPISKRRPSIPPTLEAVIMRCLAKRPADRFQTANDLLTQLEPLATPSGGMTPAQTRPTTATAATAAVAPRRRWPIVAAAVVVLGAGAVAAALFSRESALSIALGAKTPITTDPGLEILPAVSPDGKYVAYSAGTSARMRIFVRQVGGGRTLALTDDTTRVQVEPRWSPDGQRILFRQDGALLVAPAIGGSARIVVPAASYTDYVMTADWSPDGRQVALVRNDSLLVVDVDGPARRSIGTGGGAGLQSSGLHSCRWAPRGGLIACVQGNPDFVTVGGEFANQSPSAIVVVPASGGAMVTVTDSGTTSNQSPAWSADGRTLFFVSDRDGGSRDVYAVRVGPGGRPEGKPIGLTPGLGVHTIAVSADGRFLAFSKYSEEANIWALPIQAGAPASFSSAVPITSGHQVIEAENLSRDGEWLYYDSNAMGFVNIWRVRTTGGTPERLTTDSGPSFAPSPSPDGTEVAYHQMVNGSREIFVVSVTGGPRRQLTATHRDASFPQWSPDGRALVFYNQAQADSFPVPVLRRSADGTWAAKPRVVGHGFNPVWSPNGDSLVVTAGTLGVLARSADSSGFASKRVIYLPRPGSSDPIPEQAFWPDGQSIVFNSHDASGDAAFWSVPVSGGRPRLLARLDRAHPSYRPDFTTDGKRLYFPVQDRQSDVSLVELKQP